MTALSVFVLAIPLGAGLAVGAWLGYQLILQFLALCDLGGKLLARLLGRGKA